MGIYRNGSITKFNNPIEVVLASRSKLFLAGIYKILEGEVKIKIVAEASNNEEIEKYLTEIKPEFLFLDNRTLQLDINKLLNLIDKESPNTKIILFGDYSENEPIYSNTIRMTNENGSSELVHIIKDNQGKKIKHLNRMRPSLTDMELKIVELIGAGFTNKQIARKLSIKEKTVKSHLTDIYMKLGIQNRYKLMVYAIKLRRKTR